MKTEILAENNYPFDIQPESITTEFAVFRNILKDRSDVTLVLAPREIDNIVSDRETANWTNESLAKGYFSFAGDKANEREWISRIIPQTNNVSESELMALRSDVWEAVQKLFKGKSLSSAPSIAALDEGDTGFKTSNPTDSGGNETLRRGVDWGFSLDDEETAYEPIELVNGKDVSKRSTQPTVMMRKVPLDREVTTV